MKKSVALVVLLAVASAFAQERTGGYLHSDGQVPLNGNLRLKGFYISNDGDDEGISIDTSGNVTMSGGQTVTGTISAEQLTSTDDANIADDLLVNGDSRVGGALIVTGNVTTAAGTVSAEQLTSTDDARVNDDLIVSGKVDVVEGPINLATDAVVLSSSSDDGVITIKDNSGNIDALIKADGVSYVMGGTFSVGTNAASGQFEVLGENAQVNVRLPTHDADGHAYIRGTDENSDTVFELNKDASDNGTLSIYDGVDGSSAIKVFLDASGDSYFMGGSVGFGTNDPSFVLHLHAGTPTIGYDENDTGVEWQAGASASNFIVTETGVGNAMSIKATTLIADFAKGIELSPVTTNTPTEGLLYYDAEDNKLKFWNGTAWETITSS